MNVFAKNCSYDLILGMLTDKRINQYFRPQIYFYIFFFIICYLCFITVLLTRYFITLVKKILIWKLTSFSKPYFVHFLFVILYSRRQYVLPYWHFFTTYDSDIDYRWWYNNCHKAYLNGEYGNTNYADWYYWKGFDYSMKVVRIMIQKPWHWKL